MGLLDLINKDESFEYISLKEAISFLTEKTNSTIQEVAIYLLNKDVPQELACHTRGSDYKIKETSGKHFDYGMFRPYGRNWALEYLTNISERHNCTNWNDLNSYGAGYWENWDVIFNGRNIGLLENTYWYRQAFYNYKHIQSLNLFNENLCESNQSLIPIWDKNYLDIQFNDALDSEILDIDLSFYELSDLQLESEQSSFQEKEIPLFYLNDTLTIIEASCIISGDNPAEILDIQDNPTLLASYKKFRNAKSLIESAINLRTLNEYTDIGIATHEFKTFLTSKKIFIEGFNDSSDKEDCIEELTEQIQSQLIYISQIENEVGFYQSLSHSSLSDADFDKLLEAVNGGAFQLRGEKGILEQRNLFLKQKLEKSQLEIERLNALLESYPQSSDELTQSLDSFAPEQEIPNSRKRNNILKIISILSQMADLPHEPFTAFNVLEAFAIQNNKEIPSKHTVADWLKKARDSN